MNTLHMMVGLPRSGKSTLARSMGFPIVETDAIRTVLHATPFKPNVECLVFAHAHMMVEALFEAGHTDVVLDATAHTTDTRDDWISGQYVRKFYCVDTPLEVCLQRAKETNQEYLLPVIERMSKSLTFPLIQEEMPLNF